MENYQILRATTAGKRKAIYFSDKNNSRCKIIHVYSSGHAVIRMPCNKFDTVNIGDLKRMY